MVTNYNIIDDCFNSGDTDKSMIENAFANDFEYNYGNNHIHTHTQKKYNSKKRKAKQYKEINEIKLHNNATYMNIGESNVKTFSSYENDVTSTLSKYNLINNVNSHAQRQRYMQVIKQKMANVTESKIRIPKHIEKILLNNPTIGRLEELEKKFYIPRKILGLFLMEFLIKNQSDQYRKKKQQQKEEEEIIANLQNVTPDFASYLALKNQIFMNSKHQEYQEIVLLTFKEFTHPKLRNVSPHFKKELFTKVCCLHGGELNYLLEYLLCFFHIDLRIDNDHMLELCVRGNNITGFKMLYNEIVNVAKQQIDHLFFGNILKYSSKKGFLEIVKIIFTNQVFMSYLHLYLESSILCSLKRNQYHVYSYLCEYLVSDNCKNYELRKLVLTKVLEKCAIYDNFKGFKFAVKLIKNIKDPEDKNLFTIDQKYLILCIKNKSKKMCKFLLKKLFSNKKYNKQLLENIEQVIFDCIKINEFDFVDAITQLINTYDKKPRWNKLIKRLFRDKFIETVDLYTFEYILDKLKTLKNFEKIHNFNEYITYFITQSYASEEIATLFVDFLYDNNISIPFNWKNIPQHFEILFNANNTAGTLFIGFIIMKIYSLDNTIISIENIKQIEHNIKPRAVRKIFDNLLEIKDLTLFLVKILGFDYFNNNRFFIDRLLLSINCLDNLHKKIIKIAKYCDIPLPLDEKDHEILRYNCKTGNLLCIIICLDCYVLCGIDINFSNPKLTEVIEQLRVSNNEAYKNIILHDIYIKYLENEKQKAMINNFYHDLDSEDYIFTRKHKNSNIFKTGTVLGNNNSLFNNEDLSESNNSDSTDQYDTSDSSTGTCENYDSEIEDGETIIISKHTGNKNMEVIQYRDDIITTHIKPKVNYANNYDNNGQLSVQKSTELLDNNYDEYISKFWGL